ncbi:putative bifunctional diguanylate cyclase/phosphodiesterase [Azomonas macrocytogenes]|uniref:cyclic-guanylate-specific phosphodiesterase n=1 Tax=Azomonas macrocytogenes TaxID=69962 RepID=A0A839T3U0_AZOMA|nr:bifunctional diguanylate cyclase/phosphodiesterase [Azomonas macrocytogenes]MBB3104207.1 diguanylate cyclase (GGDEF)-like protein [Azomonas macrocytogenes]
MKEALRKRLSLKLLRFVLLTALAVGLVLSITQTTFNAYQTWTRIETEAQQILHTTRTLATHALDSQDQELSVRIMSVLIQHEAVQQATLTTPDRPLLAHRERPLINLPPRWLTDALFGQTREFSIELAGDPPRNEYYGSLSIQLDTALYGAEFLDDSSIIFILDITNALILALVLYLIYQWLLTRPLTNRIHYLARINPEHSCEHKLPQIKGHEQNELGLWVKTANGLLAAIEHNKNLRMEAETTLQRMAQYDMLTGLPNRQQLQNQLELLMSGIKHIQQCIAVLCIGLDDFKGINERFGYQLGDQLLVALAERLRGLDASHGTLARLSGDAFALIQTNMQHPYETAELADRILQNLEAPFLLDGHSVRLRGTIGITLYPEDGDHAEKLLQKAEQTMTLAKQRSRNRYQFYVASLDCKIRQRRELQENLREALEQHEFHLLYQPLIDLQRQRIFGAEALLRWQHPQHGYISPMLFIPLAEESGSIVEIGKWVMEQACSQLHQWHERGFGNFRMGINLSTVQLYHDSTPVLIESLMRRYELPPESIEVEVTETVLMEDIDSAAKILHKLRESGALIAIDDFGTGYSSLSYLKSLPVDKIKIDASFVRDLAEDEDNASIVRAIIQLGTSLGMRVIAEGVECIEQERYLIQQGCHEAQGYYYSKPLSAEAMTKLIRRSRYPDAATTKG